MNMFESSMDSGSRQASAQKYYGKYPGLVLENTPPEDASHRGELMVKVPGILEETPDGESQRPLQVLARPCFHPSFFFIPAVDTQVWVEFVAGDINFPIWTGVWYPDDAAPKTTEDKAPTEFQKVIRTVSGHVVQLDDTEGDETIFVWHRKKSFFNIDKDGNITIEHKDGMIIEMKENKVIITADDVEISGNTSIGGDLTVGTGSTTTISGNQITGG